MHINELRRKNPTLTIHSIFDEVFNEYGCVIDKYDFVKLKQYAADELYVPASGNSYVPSVEELEKLKAYSELSNEFFGELPIQIGFCGGNSDSLNGFEYHKTSEIDISITDYVIFLGKRNQIKDNFFNTNDAVAFFVPKYISYELYATTLHLAPCKLSRSGFKQVIVLPKGTNAPLSNDDRKEGEDELLFARNKWLIIHPEHPFLKNSHAVKGVIGENISVEY